MSAAARTKANLNQIFQKRSIARFDNHGEVGLHVAIYQDRNWWWTCGAESPTRRPGAKWMADTLFPVFSVIKAVTATALHIQAERGLIEYEQPIAHYWPEFAAHGKDRTTITDALSHRSGIPQMPEGVTPELMADYGWMVDQLAQMKPWFEPGTTNAYQCYSFGWIIAEMVRRTDPKQRPFGAFVQEEICAPLGIRDLWIGIPDAARAPSGAADRPPGHADAAGRTFLQVHPAASRLSRRGLRAARRAAGVHPGRGRNHERPRSGAPVRDARQWRRVGRRPPAVRRARALLQQSTARIPTINPTRTRFPGPGRHGGILAGRPHGAGRGRSQPAHLVPSGSRRLDRMGEHRPAPGGSNLPQPDVQSRPTIRSRRSRKQSGRVSANSGLLFARSLTASPGGERPARVRE